MQTNTRGEMMDVEYVIEQLKSQIREYVNLSGALEIVTGLSGGIDSAVVNHLCRLAIPKSSGRYIKSVYMPDRFTSNDTDNRNLVKKLAGFAQSDYYEFDIEPVYEAFYKLWEPPDDITQGNLRSRIRMVSLYMIANDINLLVAGTSNKTELRLGYFTKYGDGGIDFEPIGDLYKDEVYELAAYLELPDEVLTKAPSAGLWKDQTDEDELGYDYPTIDRILRYLQTDWHDAEWKSHAIVKMTEDGIKPKDVKRIQDMIDRNEHKNTRPPIFHVKKGD